MIAVSTRLRCGASITVTEDTGRLFRADEVAITFEGVAELEAEQ